ncbi:MAG: 26S proteasome non-ATPase regulatory subunit 14, partial [Marteilia pararefringens]
GKVVIDAFRLNDSKNNLFSTVYDNRQTTSNNGYMRKPTPQALIHGLNRMYYSINCEFKIGYYEKKLLMPFKNRNWFDAFYTERFSELRKDNLADLAEVCRHLKALTKQTNEDRSLSTKEIALKRIGVTNHHKHLVDITGRIGDRSLLFDRSMILELYSLLQFSSLDRLRFETAKC